MRWDWRGPRTEIEIIKGVVQPRAMLLTLEVIYRFMLCKAGPHNTDVLHDP